VAERYLWHPVSSVQNQQTPKKLLLQKGSKRRANKGKEAALLLKSESQSVIRFPVK